MCARAGFGNGPLLFAAALATTMGCALEVRAVDMSSIARAGAESGFGLVVGERRSRPGDLPSHCSDLGFEAEASGSGFDLLVVAAGGAQLGADFDQTGGLDVGAVEGAELVAVAGDRLEQQARMCASLRSWVVARRM